MLTYLILIATALFTGFLAGFGVTGGVHRYWTHRTYKANLPLRIFLMICFSIAGQVSFQQIFFKCRGPCCKVTLLSHHYHIDLFRISYISFSCSGKNLIQIIFLCLSHDRNNTYMHVHITFYLHQFHNSLTTDRDRTNVSRWCYKCRFISSWNCPSSE